VVTLDRGREILDGGGGGRVVKAMQARETPMTAFVGATMCRCGRRTGEGTTAAIAVMGRCVVGEEERRGAAGDGGGGEGCDGSGGCGTWCDGRVLCCGGGGGGRGCASGGDGFGDEEMMCAGGGVKMEKIGWAWGADARRVRQIHGESGNKFLSSLHTF
jgi:hypothetical protein